ncbi:DnaD domain-containing protein [Gracilibacillus timonensis]|uniref:DnaD domain-containing protein n=1 Tax=Gracilibacillus timonensis TaxID=1816696 RepID=UPI0008261D12|nr:DnaD domain-containing protein [Gracilibacillus timonensis]
MNEHLQKVIQDQINVPAELIRNYALLSINEMQLAIILQIYLAQREGNPFPTPEGIAEHLSISSNQCSHLLRQLIQQNLLQIEENRSNDMINEYYSLDPLWERLYHEKEQPVESLHEKVGEVFQKFEQEFGRALSPFEIEMINNWLDEDHHEISLIYAALREAVLMGKVNFKYIDRILMEWKKKGIQSPQQAQQSSKEFHQNIGTKQTKQTDTRYDKSLYYNWLEE